MGRVVRRLEFETLISDLSSKFINLPHGEVDREIENAQGRVCEVVGVDLSVLWEASSVSPEDFRATHVYYRGGAPPSPGPMLVEQFPYVRGQILAGNTVCVSSLDQLPAEGAVDREHAELFGIKSSLNLPMSVGLASPVGCLTFNAIEAERDWPDALVNRLQLVAQVFTNALARKRADEALRESEERLAMAAEAAEAGLWVLDHAARVFSWATPRARMIFGLPPDEVVTVERLLTRVHPGDRELLLAAIERAARSPEQVEVDYRILSEEGEVRWIQGRARAHFTATGAPDRLTGSCIDITDRKRGEEALCAGEARLQAGVDIAGLGFVEVDESTGVVFADDRLRDIIGSPPDCEGMYIIQFWMEHLHPDDVARVIEERKEALDGDRPDLATEYRYLHPVRGEIWIQHLGRPTFRDASGFAVRSFSVFRDITARKRVEQDLRHVSRHMIRVHEEERGLLARELHDDVSQRLAVLAIDAGRAELASPEGEQAEAMRALREGLVSLSDDVHSLAYQLHPSVLDELGLAEALRTEGERHGREGLHVWVHVDQLPRVVARDVALCLFRVAQEALSNVARHAYAKIATVRLREMDGGLLLAVSDDGVGADLAKTDASQHLGLMSMRERLRLVDGTLDIESTPNQGTTVIAWVPWGEGS